MTAHKPKTKISTSKTVRQDAPKRSATSRFSHWLKESVFTAKMKVAVTRGLAGSAAVATALTPAALFAQTPDAGLQEDYKTVSGIYMRVLRGLKQNIWTSSTIMYLDKEGAETGGYGNRLDARLALCHIDNCFGEGTDKFFQLVLFGPFASVFDSGTGEDIADFNLTSLEKRLDYPLQFADARVINVTDHPQHGRLIEIEVAPIRYADSKPENGTPSVRTTYSVEAKKAAKLVDSFVGTPPTNY